MGADADTDTNAGESEFDAVKVERDLTRYYDLEGDERAGRPLAPQRIDRRDRFIASLPSTQRVLEIGAGPGRDGVAFVEAEHVYVGVDLSIEHARHCRAAGADAALATARHLPFGNAAFDVVWTMSTLMHIPDNAIGAALNELARVLRSGGVAVCGVWGGNDTEEALTQQAHPERPARLFSRRSARRWQALLGAIGQVETFEVWDEESPGFAYQWAKIRRS